MFLNLARGSRAAHVCFVLMDYRSVIRSRVFAAEAKTQRSGRDRSISQIGWWCNRANRVRLRVNCTEVCWRSVFVLERYLFVFVTHPMSPLCARNGEVILALGRNTLPREQRDARVPQSCPQATMTTIVSPVDWTAFDPRRHQVIQYIPLCEMGGY